MTCSDHYVSYYLLWLFVLDSERVSVVLWRVTAGATPYLLILQLLLLSSHHVQLLNVFPTVSCSSLTIRLCIILIYMSVTNSQTCEVRYV